MDSQNYILVAKLFYLMFCNKFREKKKFHPDNITGIENVVDSCSVLWWKFAFLDAIVTLYTLAKRGNHRYNRREFDQAPAMCLAVQYSKVQSYQNGKFNGVDEDINESHFSSYQSFCESIIGYKPLISNARTSKKGRFLIAYGLAFIKMNTSFDVYNSKISNMENTCKSESQKLVYVYSEMKLILSFESIIKKAIMNSEVYESHLGADLMSGVSRRLGFADNMLSCSRDNMLFLIDNSVSNHDHNILQRDSGHKQCDSSIVTKSGIKSIAKRKFRGKRKKLSLKKHFTRAVTKRQKQEIAVFVKEESDELDVFELFDYSETTPVIDSFEDVFNEDNINEESDITMNDELSYLS